MADVAHIPRSELVSPRGPQSESAEFGSDVGVVQSLQLQAPDELDRLLPGAHPGACGDPLFAGA